MTADKRHIITAMGITCSLGDSVAEAFSALLEGRPRTGPPPCDLPFETVCGSVLGPLDPLPQGLRAYDSRMTRIAMRALLQISQDLERAKLRHGPSRIGVVVGTSTGGLDGTELAYRHFMASQQRHPSFSLRHTHAFDALGALISEFFGLSGPSYTVSTACTSSTKAIASGLRLLESGASDAVLVIGADALCETTLRGFHSLGVLSSAPARPFSAARDGIHLGEGAGALLIERGGSGVRIAGVGESSDAHSMSAPHPEALGAIAAIRDALRRAGVDASAVDYVNAHGTGTAQNDAVESKAIEATLPRTTQVSSTKGLTGHTLGASGAIEAVLTAAAIERQMLLPSVGAQPVDPNLGIHIVRAPTPQPLRVALSHAFAFGGSNAVLVLSHD